MKISTPAHKCIILTSIGNVSFNCSKHTEEVIKKIVQLFSDFISSETHDGTVQCAIQQLNLWLSKPLVSSLLTPELIKNLNNFFKV